MLIIKLAKKEEEDEKQESDENVCFYKLFY